MCNVALLDSVSMCMCPREPAFVHVHARTHTYSCLRLHTVCARVRVSGCVSVPQYQILLSQLSARLSLVVICLSTSQPSASPSVSFSSFPRVFHLNPSVLHPSFDLTSSSLPHCFPVFFFFCGHLTASLPRCPLHPSLWAIPPPFFLLKYFQCLASLWLVFTSQPFFLKTLPWIFIFSNFGKRISSTKCFHVCYISSYFMQIMLGIRLFVLKWACEDGDSG